jgi:hypothetical protein
MQATIASGSTREIMANANLMTPKTTERAMKPRMMYKTALNKFVICRKLLEMKLYLIGQIGCQEMVQ